jgi:hypothetical protein
VKHVRALLSLVASAAAVVALAAPAQAVVPDGSYTIRDTVTGQCLTPAGDGFTRVVLGDCTPWEVAAQSDGGVRISEAGGEGRCMAVSRIRVYPPFVDALPCDFDTPKT